MDNATENARASYRLYKTELCSDPQKLAQRAADLLMHAENFLFQPDGTKKLVNSEDGAWVENACRIAETWAMLATMVGPRDDDE